MAKTKKKVADKVKTVVAKKTVEKKPEKKETTSLLVTHDHVECLIKEIDKLNARIDRLVAALSTAKPIKKDY